MAVSGRSFGRCVRVSERGGEDDEKIDNACSDK